MLAHPNTAVFEGFCCGACRLRQANNYKGPRHCRKCLLRENMNYQDPNDVDSLRPPSPRFRRFPYAHTSAKSMPKDPNSSLRIAEQPQVAKKRDDVPPVAADSQQGPPLKRRNDYPVAEEKNMFGYTQETFTRAWHELGLDLSEGRYFCI